jgi:hypothetical protein
MLADRTKDFSGLRIIKEEGKSTFPSGLELVSEPGMFDFALMDG